jgi:large subunit ribosomal protein L29
MRIGELRNLSADELRVRERELVEEIFHLRLRRATAQLSNPMKLRESRRTLARVKTLLRAHAPQGEATK